MTNPFEYDVFISFSSADEEIVRPIWQELCSNGLRVFWSDATLKKEVGNSWFEVIEKSLERSKHLLLICSDNAMNSKWVQREYRAFYNQCYSPDTRKLIPVLTRGFKANSLPLFLRELQVGKIDDPDFIREIIPLLGGVDIEKLHHELQSFAEKVRVLSIEKELLIQKLEVEGNKIRALSQQNTEVNEKIAKLTTENNLLHEKLQQQENLVSNATISRAHSEEVVPLNNELDRQIRKPEQVVSDDIRERGRRAVEAARSRIQKKGDIEDEERERVEKYGIEVVRCPKCKTINSLSFAKCISCSAPLSKEKPIRNPYL